jgi:uncharacterized OB-fold protein
VTPEELGLGDWVRRPQGKIALEVAPFWEGVRAHEFRLCRCSRCGRCYWPYTVCNAHDDIPDFSEMEWAPVSGRGAVFANLVVHRVTDPAYAGEVPYALALVELDEGPLFPTRIVACEPAMVAIGQRVQAVFVDVPETGATIPLFAPADGAA